MILTKEQLRQIARVGADDETISQVLAESAASYVDEHFPELHHCITNGEDQSQIDEWDKAVQAYVDGFCGTTVIV